jgi:uncharacterized protein
MNENQLPSNHTFEIQPVRNGRGLVARQAIAPGEHIVELTGRITTVDEVWAYWETDPQRAANCVSYDAEFYIDPDGEAVQFANHSCAPNAGIVREAKNLVLKACEPILPGQEITFDYATLSTADDEWEMKCNCGHASCRGTIGTVASIPDDVYRRYLELGIVPEFVAHTR